MTPLADQTTEADAGDATTDKPAEVPATTSSGQIKRAREVIDAIRKRADLSAKALGAVGGAALGAVSLEKVGDLSPTAWDSSTVVWAGLLILGFLAMAAAIAGIVIRLEMVNRPVPVMSRLERMNLKDDEREAVAQVFADMADLNDAPSLRAYEARAARLDRIADRSHEKRAEELRRRAAVIREEVQATHARAAADVVRARGANALAGRWALAWYAAAVGGFVLFTIGVDHLESEREEASIAREKEILAVRKERLALAKECAATKQAYTDQGLTVTLPTAAKCPDATAADPGEDTDEEAAAAAAAEAGALTDLATRYGTCQAAIEAKDGARNRDNEARCDRILRAMETLAARQRSG